MICREMVHYESFGMWEKSIPVGIVFVGLELAFPIYRPCDVREATF